MKKRTTGLYYGCYKFFRTLPYIFGGLSALYYIIRSTALELRLHSQGIAISSRSLFAAIALNFLLGIVSGVLVFFFSAVAISPFVTRTDAVLDIRDNLINSQANTAQNVPLQNNNYGNTVYQNGNYMYPNNDMYNGSAYPNNPNQN